MNNENDHLHNIPLEDIPLEDLAEKCRHETVRFRRGKLYDPQYCFELFKRAFQGLEGAWKAVQAQYESQVAGWVRKHPGFGNSGEQVEYFVNGVFIKFINAMMPQKYQKFPTLGHLLRYLQMCVHSVVSDYNRSNDLAESFDPAREPKRAGKPESRKGESMILNRVHWERCREWIDAQLNDIKEQLVVRLYIDDALKPREIYALSPEIFEDVGEIYRIRQNVFARLSRNPEFDEFCGEG